MLPVDDPHIVFAQAYKLYGRTRGLKCKGDGERAVRLLCAKCGKMQCGCENAGVTMTDWKCPCPLLESGECKPIASLMVMLPEISPAGVWQIDTSSYHSIVDVNSAIAQDGYIRALCGRIAMVPLDLIRRERETHANGQKGTHWTLHLHVRGSVEDIARIAASRRPTDYLIERPHEVGDELPALPEPAELQEPESQSASEALTDRVAGSPAQQGSLPSDDPDDPLAGDAGPLPPDSPTASPAPPTGITPQQKRQIYELRKICGIRQAAEFRENWLSAYGFEDGEKLTAAQAAELIGKLEIEAKRIKTAFNRDAATARIDEAIKGNLIKPSAFNGLCVSLAIDEMSWPDAPDGKLEALAKAVKEAVNEDAASNT